MSERPFFEPDAKRRTADVIRAIEAETAAEVVVTVRHAADRYLGTSLAFGAACAVLALLVMLVSPRTYDVRTMPVDALLAFVIGAGACATAPPLRRRLVRRARSSAALARASRAAFDALGIGKTRGRTGLLVYVALFERTAVLLPDEGIPVAVLGEPYVRAEAAIRSAVAAADVEAFLAALASLREPLAAALPRLPDDENELCDDVV